MKNKLRFFVLGALMAAAMTEAEAQVTSTSSFTVAQRPCTTRLFFNWHDEGKATPMWWGFDTAWMSDDNLRRGAKFAGRDLIDYVRVCYSPTDAVENDVLSDRQLELLTTRANIVLRNCKPDVKLCLDNASGDEPAAWYRPGNSNKSVDAYLGYPDIRASRYAKVIDLHAKKYEEMGLKVGVISPFNEPDYTWVQGYSADTRMDDMLNIFKKFREDEQYKDRYKDVELSGPNTLDCNYALQWYNHISNYVQESGTHQMAGTFDSYASFFEQVRKDGKKGVNDEVHNTTEAMVGAEYGMNIGIWWGSAEHSRSQFMKATYHANPGKRLGYAEHRGNWTSASVYRHTDGTVEAFAGSSERMGYETTYGYSCLDEPIWVNGEGPLREYSLTIPGGWAYWKGQTNAETVLNVQHGTDIQPSIYGIYQVVNAASPEDSPLLLSVPGVGWDLDNFTRVTTQDGSVNQLWSVDPVEATIGGDFSYYILFNRANLGGKWLLDVLDWGLDDGSKTLVYPGVQGTNEQWYLRYVGDGKFRIMSRHSALCLEPAELKSDAEVVTNTVNGSESQMWLFLPEGVKYSKAKPAVPTALKSEKQVASVALSWEYADNGTDLKGFEILRSKADNDDWSLIARNVKETSFVDNSVREDLDYKYKVRAVTTSFVASDCSEEVFGAVNGDQGCVMCLLFEDNTLDNTVNGNHAALYGVATYEDAPKEDDGKVIVLNGNDNYLTLPAEIMQSEGFTFSANVKWNGGWNWQRIFDFGNGTDQYFFLTPESGLGMRVALKNGGGEIQLNTEALPLNEWHKITVTADAGSMRLYVDDELKAENTTAKERPWDFKPVLNYIGRSQFASDAMFNGAIQDVVIYNYALNEEQIKNIATGINEAHKPMNGAASVSYDLQGRKVNGNHKGIVIIDGQKVIK